MIRAPRSCWLTLALLLLLGTALWLRPPVAADEPSRTDPALERARRQVQMLDDLYKTAIVLITENYVNEKSDLAAGDAFQALFKTMKEKGYHEVRLIDATGQPYDDDNAPRDDFERQAVRALKSGKPWFEQVQEQEGQRFLRAATPIPVVMKKCTLCHEHYADVPAGQIIGALGYRLKIE